MGMYDFLGGHQVKCFYEPLVEHDLDKRLGLPPVEKLELVQTCGSLRDYKWLSKVPYRTMWYDYTKNFMIFDPADVEGNGLVHVICCGRYLASGHYNALNTILFPIRKVIDTSGNELNIKTKGDFHHILVDAKETFNTSSKMMDESVTNQALNPTQKAEVAEKVNRMWDKYYERWYKQKTDADKNAWNVGGFIYGLATFANSDDDVLKYINFFKEKHGEENVYNMLLSYALWCRDHDNPILFKYFEELFFRFPTRHNLIMALYHPAI